MNGKRFSEEKAGRSGFYLALAVCLVAVGIAAWSTYDAVTSYTEVSSPQVAEESQEEADAPSASEEDREGAGNASAAKGNAGRDDPQAPPASSALETTGQVAQPTPAPTPEPPAATPAPQPANGPLYELS